MENITQIEYDTRVPMDEAALRVHKEELEATVRNSQSEEVRATLSSVVTQINLQLNALRHPRAARESLETAAFVHNQRYYKARGLKVPLMDETRKEVEDMLDNYWRPTPGNLQWCSCMACIHNCETLRQLGLEADAAHVGQHGG